MEDLSQIEIEEISKENKDLKEKNSYFMEQTEKLCADMIALRNYILELEKLLASGEIGERK